VPFPRDEYTGDLTAYFNLDLAQIRGYRLGKDVEDLLVILAIYKIQKVLHDGLRFRTACDLDTIGDPVVERPVGFSLPSIDQVEMALPSLIERASSNFADPRVTTVTYTE
jgi:CRISPR-associated protein Csb1